MSLLQLTSRWVTGCALLGLTLPGWSQTNPTAQALPYSFTTLTGTTLPSGMAAHYIGTGTTPGTVRTTANGDGDMPNGTSTTGGWGAETANGISMLASGVATRTAGAIVLAINTSNRTNIEVSWTARLILQQASRDNSLALQYRVGTTGAYTDLNPTVFSSQGLLVNASQTFSRILLPAACDNQPVVQMRWVYWESNGSSGSRDRIAVDDISITGAAILAQDHAANQSAGTWVRNVNPNTGTGWGSAWTLQTNNNNDSQGGFFLGDSALNGSGTGINGDINTTGTTALGMYANSGDQANAYRTMPSMRTGDQYRFFMDTGFIASGQSVGIGIRNASSQDLLELFYSGSSPTNSYQINDNAGTAYLNPNLGYTQNGLDCLLTVGGTGGSTYSLTVRTMGTSTQNLYFGTFKNPAGGQVPAILRFFNSNAGTGASNNAYFNRPTVSDALSPTITSATAVNERTIDVTFSEAMTTTTVQTLTNWTRSGTGIGTLSANPASVTYVTGNVWRLQWNAGQEMRQGSTLTIAASNISDLAGLTMGTPNSATLTGIGIAPSIVSITRNTANPVRSVPSQGVPCQFLVTYSEAVSAVTAGSFATSGTLSPTIGTPTTANGGLTWSVPVTYAANSTGLVSLRQTSTGSVVDLAGNALSSANIPFNTSDMFTVDLRRPTLTSVAYLDPIPTSATSYRLQLVFDEPVTNFNVGTFANTLQITGGSLATNFPFLTGLSPAVTESNSTTYTVTTTIGTTASGTLTSAFFYASGGITDLIGNQPNVPVVIPTLTLDYDVPVVTLSSPASSITNLATIPVTVNLSEIPASNLTAGALSLLNGTVSGFTVTSSTQYAFNLLPSSEGTVSVTVPAEAVRDLAGNPNAAVALSFTYDATPVGTGISAPSASLTNSGPVDFTVTYTGASAVTLNSGNVTVNSTGTAAAGSVTILGSGTAVRTVRLSSITGDGTLGINIAANTASDAATNGADAAGPSATFTVDNTAPTVNLTSPVGSVTKDPFTVTATFNDPVTGMALGGFSVTNGSAGTFNAVSSTVYTAEITPAANGLVSVTVSAASATDAAGNANSVSSTVSTTADITAPSSAASAADVTQVVTGRLDFTASDTGVSGVASVALWVQVPGSGVFTNTGLTTTTSSGTFVYTPTAGNGVYGFATVATDTIGNVESLPVVADISIAINTVSNGVYTVTVPNGGGTFVFPMTDDLDTTITVASAPTGGTISVGRSVPRSATPAYFAVPGQLLNENLTITRTGLPTFTATLEWGADPAAVSAVTGGITQVWSFNGGSTPSGTFTPASVTGGVITVNGLTSFSDWYAGNPVAVPVSVSAWTIE